jgi:hypothetical protein
MLEVDRSGDRRGQAILAQHFLVENETQAQNKKKTLLTNKTR